MITKNEIIQLFLDKTSYTKQQIKDVSKIKSGFTNLSYKIRTKDELEFQVRISNNKFINRNVEKLIFDNLKISLIYFDANTGNMIRQWIPGKCIKKWDYEKINILANKLKKFHLIPITKIPKFNAYSYTELLKNNEFDNMVYTRYIELINKYPNESNVVCHCDLNPQNIIFDKKTSTMSIIDYELTRLNSVYFELANVARESMNKKQIIFLAEQYGNIDLNKLKDFLIITCLYAYQWTLSINSNPQIKKYRKHVIKRLKFCQNLDFSDVNEINTKLKNKYSDLYETSNNDDDFININNNETKGLEGIEVKNDGFTKEEKKHSCSCKIKGKKKYKTNDEFENDFLSKEEFDKQELEFQEKIVKYLNQKEERKK